MGAAKDSHYRRDIDGLRAIAVLTILVFHANNAWLPGGFIGVDIFFVISGFLITGILLRDMREGHYSIWRFYARRIRRIFPALLSVLVASLALGWVVLMPDEFKKLSQSISAASGFFANVHFWKQSGYFDMTAERKPLLHLWSLGVEEQFYILWPLLLWLGLKFRRVVLPLIAVLTVASLSFSILRSPAHSISSFFLPHTRFWELMLGGLLAYGEGFLLRTATGWKRDAGALCGLGLILLAVALFSKLDAYPGWRALLPVGGTLLLLATRGSVVDKHVLSKRLMVGIGLISYPLYLWHWPLFAYARILYWQPPSAIVMLALTALAFCLATFTYHCIEAPIRFGRFRQRKVWPLLLAMALVAAAALRVESADGFKERQQANPRFQDLVSAHEFTTQKIACPDSMRPEGNWCYIARPGPVSAAVLGDSHAEAFFPGLATRDSARNWMMIGYSSCPPLLGIRSHLADTPDACLVHIQRAVALLREHSEIRTVVLASLGQFYIGNSVSPQHTDKVASSHWRLESSDPEEAKLSRAELFYRGLERTVTTLERAGKRVVLVIDVPTLDFWSVDCLGRLGRISYLLGMAKTPCSIEQAGALEQQHAYREAVQRVTQRHPQLRVYDTFNVLCDGQHCAAGDQDMLYYSDSHHLSVRGSQHVAEHFVPWLNASASGNKQR